MGNLPSQFEDTATITFTLQREVNQKGPAILQTYLTPKAGLRAAAACQIIRSFWRDDPSFFRKRTVVEQILTLAGDYRTSLQTSLSAIQCLDTFTFNGEKECLLVLTLGGLEIVHGCLAYVEQSLLHLFNTPSQSDVDSNPLYETYSFSLAILQNIYSYVPSVHLAKYCNFITEESMLCNWLDYPSIIYGQYRYLVLHTLGCLASHIRLSCKAVQNIDDFLSEVPLGEIAVKGFYASPPEVQYVYKNCQESVQCLGMYTLGHFPLYKRIDWTSTIVGSILPRVVAFVESGDQRMCRLGLIALSRLQSITPVIASSAHGVVEAKKYQLTEALYEKLVEIKGFPVAPTVELVTRMVENQLINDVRLVSNLEFLQDQTKDVARDLYIKEALEQIRSVKVAIPGISCPGKVDPSVSPLAGRLRRYRSMVQQQEQIRLRYFLSGMETPLLVLRGQVFRSIFTQLLSLTPVELRLIRVIFIDEPATASIEEGVDMGGLIKEMLYFVAEDLQHYQSRILYPPEDENIPEMSDDDILDEDEDAPDLSRSSSRSVSGQFLNSRYVGKGKDQYNRLEFCNFTLLGFNDDQRGFPVPLADPVFYKVYGRLIGLALLHGIQSPVPVNLALMKVVLGHPLTFEDIGHLQEGFLEKVVMPCLECPDISEWELYFVRSISGISFDLTKSGENIPVTNENRVAYLEKMASSILGADAWDALQAFAQGVRDCLPISPRDSQSESEHSSGIGIGININNSNNSSSFNSERHSPSPSDISYLSSSPPTFSSSASPVSPSPLSSFLSSSPSSSSMFPFSTSSSISPFLNFTPEELLDLLQGTGLSVNDLEKHCQYRDPPNDRANLLRRSSRVSARHPVIVWFWEFMYEVPAEVQLKVLAFCTGLRRLPLGGARELSPPFSLMIDPKLTANHLPIACTCGNLLTFPEYDNKEQLSSKLLAAINEQTFSKT